MKYLRFNKMKIIIWSFVFCLTLVGCFNLEPIIVGSDSMSYLDSEFWPCEENDASYVYKVPKIFSVYGLGMFYQIEQEVIVSGDTAVSGKKIILNGDYTFLSTNSTVSARFINGKVKRIIETYENGEMEYRDFNHIYDENPYYIDYHVNSERKTMSSYTVNYLDATGEFAFRAITDWMALYKEIEMYGKKRKFYYQVLFWPEVDEHINYLNSIR